MTIIRNEKKSPNYSFTAKILHWGFVILFAYGIIKQVDNLNQLKDSSLLRSEILFASAFLVFLAARYLYMKITQKTSLPKDTSKSQKLAAKIVHLGMYLNLGAIAASGLLIGALFSLGFTDGFLIELVITVHEFAVSLIFWLIAVHVSAAIYHRFRRDGVWNSMVPFWKE